MLKRTLFKTKYSPLKRNVSLKSRHGLKRSSKRMRSFREVKGENENVLQVHEADRQFSLAIRTRDKQCLACGSALFLGCSHYFGRSTYSTRYDPLNCITLCSECHEKWELDKDGVYKDFMIIWLGEEEFELLKERSKLRVSPYEAITSFMASNFRPQSNIINF